MKTNRDLEMKATTNPDLHRLAETHGVQLKRHTGFGKGYYHAPTHTITTRRGMSIQQYKSTLAHELAHAIRRDTPIDNEILHARNERRVDIIAANMLITKEAFIDAYIWHNGHMGAIADELEVTKHLLNTWIQANMGVLTYNIR